MLTSLPSTGTSSLLLSKWGWGAGLQGGSLVSSTLSWAAAQQSLRAPPADRGRRSHLARVGDSEDQAGARTGMWDRMKISLL